MSNDSPCNLIGARIAEKEVQQKMNCQRNCLLSINGMNVQTTRSNLQRISSDEVVI